jgi:uncharacterized membrane protein YgcG
MRSLLALARAIVGPRAPIDAPRITAAVEAAEQRCGAELVVAIAPFFLGRIQRAAERAFARLGVAATRAHTGVLIFVVPSRRAVVVLADHGAQVRGSDTVWRDAAARVATGFARGDGTGGLVDAIDAIAGALAPLLPRAPDAGNQLPDAPYVR